MMRIARMLLMTAGLLQGALTFAYGQQTVRPEWTRLRSGTLLRLSIGPEVLYGRIRGHTATTVELEGPCSVDGSFACSARAIRLEWPTVQAAAVRRSHFGKGLLIGAGAGVALGAIVGLLAGDAGDLSSSTVLLLSIGNIGGAGALIGGIAGGATHSWRPLPVPALVVLGAPHFSAAR